MSYESMPQISNHLNVAINSRPWAQSKVPNTSLTGAEILICFNPSIYLGQNPARHGSLGMMYRSSLN